MILARAPSLFLLLALGLVPSIANAQAPAPSPSPAPVSPSRLQRKPVLTPTPPATPGAGTGAAPATTPAPPTGATLPPLGGTSGAAAGTGTGAAGTATGAAASKDTEKLPQFEQAMGEFQPKNPNYKVSFSLEDADLTELVRVIGQLTGRRFIFGGKVRNIKASVYSPQKVTVAEAYQAFLSILETNGLTVIPHGRFLKIVETGGIASQNTPIIGTNQAAPGEDRFVTRLHRLQNVGSDEMATILAKFKSKEGDISVHSPSNLLIITDTGTNIRRMMNIVEEIDVGGAGDQIWMQPLHYAAAGEVAARVNDLFDIKAGSTPAGKGAAAAGAGGAVGTSAAGGGDFHVAKVLADDRTNSVIIVATEKAYLRILELIKRIDVPQSAEGEVRVLPLQHADATELAKTLNEIVTGAAQPASGGAARPAAGGAGATPAANAGIFEGGVKVSADKSTNSIVVTSSPRDFASLRSVIDKLDKPRRQVFIEAVIMDLSVNRSREFKSNFHGGSAEDVRAPNDTILYGGLNPLKSATQLTPGQDADLLTGAALGLRGPAIPGTDNLLGTGISIPAFGLILKAIATSDDTDVLSTPHILCTDNVPAEINIGENIPLNTNVGIPSLAGIPGAAGALGALGGLGGGSSFGQRQDVGTKIKITPHVNESNQVRLEIQEEISEAKAPLAGSAGAVPIVKRTAQTQLVVQDQQTVVIGGLMRNRLVNSESKVPLLGDIPVLGFLFRSSSSQMQKTNLILVLTPSIIRDQADLRRIFERKMQERQEFLDRYFVFRENSDYEPPKDYTRTNGLLESIRQSFAATEEKRKMDELLRPKDLKKHEAIQPLEMPGPRSSVTPSAAAPAQPAGNPAPVNVTPSSRTTIKATER